MKYAKLMWMIVICYILLNLIMDLTDEFLVVKLQ